MKDERDLELCNRVKDMLVRSLRLKVSAADLVDDAPLFGGGVGLDSVDALELVVALEKEFGARIPDAAVGSEVLVSIDSIVDFIKKGQPDGGDGK